MIEFEMQDVGKDIAREIEIIKEKKIQELVDSFLKSANCDLDITDAVARCVRKKIGVIGVQSVTCHFRDIDKSKIIEVVVK